MKNQRLSQLRKEHNLAQSELAKKIGIHANVVGKYERDDAVPSLEVARNIADALHLRRLPR